MMRQKVEDGVAVALAACGDHRAEHELGARVVHPGPEDVPRVSLWLGDRPAGEAARYLDHVLLRVAAVHSERVELEQLARVVLVQPSVRVPARRPPASAGRR